MTEGTVVLMMSPTSRINAPIDRKGQFRILPDSVTVPQSRTMTLPPITLFEPTYFHARLVTKDGEQLAAGGIAPIVDPLDYVREQAEPDGSITIGPLWPGRHDDT